MKNIEISWRDVFDAKNVGEYIDTTAKNARNAGYNLVYHNGRLFYIHGKGFYTEIKILKDV